jgi:hypothetical protein
MLQKGRNVQMTISSTQARWPIVNWLSQWLRPSAQDHDLEFLATGGEEMERFRAHARARPKDLRWLAGREPGGTDLLPHMLTATGIDAEDVPEKTMRRLEQNCAACTSKYYCAGELGHRRAYGNFGEFCPNAPTLRRLQD